MKKIISLVLVCVLLVGCVFALASCGKSLSGDYKDALTGNIVYSFSGSKVTVTVDNFIGDDSVYEGKYEFVQNEEGVYDKIVFTFDNEDAQSVYGGEKAYSEVTENGESYIKIGILRYNKVEK